MSEFTRSKHRAVTLAGILILLFCGSGHSSWLLEVDARANANTWNYGANGARLDIGPGDWTLTLTEMTWSNVEPPFIAFFNAGAYHLYRLNRLYDGLSISSSTDVTLLSYFADSDPGDNLGRAVATVEPGGLELIPDPTLHVDTSEYATFCAMLQVDSGAKYSITLVEKTWANTGPPIILLMSQTDDRFYSRQFNNLGEVMIVDFSQDVGSRDICGFFLDTGPSDNSGGAVFEIEELTGSSYWLLRNDEIEELAPLSPQKDRIFTESGHNSLVPIGIDGIPGSEDDDAYSENFISGHTDPDTSVLNDLNRPLVFYQISTPYSTLSVSKQGNSLIQLDF